MKKHTFKIGDRVICNDYTHKNEIGVIESININLLYPYAVRFDDNDYCSFNYQEMKLYKPQPRDEHGRFKGNGCDRKVEERKEELRLATEKGAFPDWSKAIEGCKKQYEEYMKENKTEKTYVKEEVREIIKKAYDRGYCDRYEYDNLQSKVDKRKDELFNQLLS